MILEDSTVEVDNVVLIPPENKGDVTDDNENDLCKSMQWSQFWNKRRWYGKYLDEAAQAISKLYDD